MAMKRLQTDVPDGMRLGVAKDSDGVRGLLFDEETNKLVGHAELFEVDEDEDEDASDTARTYGSRESAEIDDEWADLIAQALTAALIVGLAKAGPPIGRWMRDKAAPALRSAPSKAKAKLSRPSRKTTNVSQIALRAAAPSDTSDREQTGIATLGRTMTGTEAQQRLTAAMMATAYAQEQMRLLQDAQIIDDHEPLGMGQALNDLSPDGVQHAVRAIIEADPTMLGTGSLKAFGLALETGHLSDEPMPVRLHAPDVADQCRD